MNTFHINRRISSFQTIVVGFALIILAGTLLLMLPIATVNGISAPFKDALFTATSATCVTGLVVHDTATYWSGFGQTIILILIQIGGMGVVTMAALFTILSGKKISLMQRSTMQEAIAAHNVGGIVKLTSFIVKCTATIEICGALLLMPVFCKEFGVGKGIWYAFFHSISAFCNAGFDLMGNKTPYSSLTRYASNVGINVIIMFLIIAGGIGFLTWDDIKMNKLHFCKYRTQSKIILSTTAILILLPALYFFFVEFAKMDMKPRILSALFQSVTPRTAGFNSVDFNQMSDVGKVVTIALMLIGGSPGSTAGGIKTTTIVIFGCYALAVFHRNEDANIFGRRISENALKNASAIYMSYLLLVLIGTCIICGIEELPFLACLFETTSAIGTVGLSLGITGQLGMVSRGILIMLMFFGRAGALTLFFATLSKGRHCKARYPLAKISVG